MEKRNFIAALAAVFCWTTAWAAEDLPEGLYAEVTTPRGVVVAELHFQEAPMTVANYVGLAEGVLGPEKGTPFFDGLTFHRVIEDFVVQGGDPDKTGSGNAGYTFPDEIHASLNHDRRGVVQMANDGPDTNGSQWCFMLREEHRLDYLHSVFGHVVQGLEVLPRIEQGDTMHVKILRIGTDAEAFRVTEESFAEMTKKASRFHAVREPGPDAHFDDPDRILPTEWDRAKAFNFKLGNYERFAGKKLYARVLATAPEVGMEAYGKATAAKLGLEKEGALVVYFAKQAEWRLWTQAEGLPVSDKERSEFFEFASQKSDEVISGAEKRAAARGETLAEDQKIKIRVDAVLDGIIQRWNGSTQ